MHFNGVFVWEYCVVNAHVLIDIIASICTEKPKVAWTLLWCDLSSPRYITSHDSAGDRGGREGTWKSGAHGNHPQHVLVILCVDIYLFF